MENIKYVIVPSMWISDKKYCYVYILGTDIKVGRCEMSYGVSKWGIKEWFVEDGYKRKGIGKQMMKLLMEDLLKDTGKPVEVIYTWNGENEYVYDWLIRNFNAVCQEDLNVLKNDSKFGWKAHLFKLDTNLVLKYFDIK